MPITAKDLESLKLSKETQKWLHSFGKLPLRDLWGQSSDGAEMMRFLEQVPIDPKLLVTLCCDIADMAMPLVFSEEPRPAECLLVLRKWAQGEATDDALIDALEQVRAVAEASDKVRTRRVSRARAPLEERREKARQAQKAFMGNPHATAETLAWVAELQKEVAQPETGTLMERINRRELNSGAQVRCHRAMTTVVFRLLRDVPEAKPGRCLGVAFGTAYALVEATVQQKVDEMRQKQPRPASPGPEAFTPQAISLLSDARVAARKREQERAEAVVASFTKKYGRSENQLYEDDDIRAEMLAALEEAEAQEARYAQNSTSTSLKMVIGGVPTTITITVEAEGLQVLDAAGVPVAREPPPPPVFVPEEEQERIHGIAMGEIADVVRKRVPWDVVDEAVRSTLKTPLN